MFNILTLSEQSCIRDVLGEAELEEALNWPVLSEGESPGDWEISIFSCLAPETARGVLLSMMLAAIEEDPDFELSDQDASCMKGAFADIDVAALIAAPDEEVIGEEFFSIFMGCIPEQLVTFMIGADVELSEKEASCVRAWVTDVDLDAVIANPDDPAVAADFVAGLIPCVPDLFLASMLEETGTELGDFSDDELSCLREWVRNADWTELTAADGDAAGVEFALELLACVPRLASSDSADAEDVTATPQPAPTPTSTPIPTTDRTSTPATGGEVEAYARECGETTASLDVAFAMMESEGSGEDLSWGDFAEMLSAVSSAYRELRPPPELQEYHDAQLRALDGLLDHALSRPGSGSFVEEFALAFAELFGLVFEVAFDAEKTDEEKETLIEEATEEVFATIFGTVFMDAVAELEEIESELSEDTLEVLTAFGCGQSVSGDFAGESVGQPEGPVTDDHGDTFESFTLVGVGAPVGGVLDYDGDVDVFAFDAEEGELYEVDVALGSLSDSVVTLYVPEGEWLASNDDYGDSFASRTVWEAPSSGEYFVEVSGYGNTGTYTLTVSLSDVVDDHTNYHFAHWLKADSTLVQEYLVLTVGEDVEGVLDYEGDVDMFVFDAEEGELYEVDVALGSLPDSVVTLYGPEGEFLDFNDDYDESLASRVIWEAPSSGEYFVEVGGFGTGSYALTVDFYDAIRSRANGDSTAPFRIGVMEAITGPVGTHGASRVDAKQMAVDEINQAGGVKGRMLELVVADSMCDAQAATDAYNHLTDVEGVKIILGTTCSGAMLGVAPLAEEDGVVLLSASATNPAIAAAGDYIFRTALNDDQVGVDTGNLLWADGVRRLAMFTASTDYAEGVRRTTVAQFEKLGGEVVSGEFYTWDGTDFRNGLAKLVSAEPDAVHITAQAELPAGTIVKQLREVGFDGPIYSEVVTIGPTALDTAGDAATGLKAVAADLDPANSKAQQFIANFRERYGYVTLAWYLGSAYDDVYITAECLERTNDDRDAESFRDCLYGITWSGVIGEEYSFDARGEVVGLSNVVLQVLPTSERTEDNQGYEILGPAPTAAASIIDH